MWSGLENLPVAGYGFRKLRYPVKKAISLLQKGSQEGWEKRIAIVKSCPDNNAIPRVPDAGLTLKSVMTMHNGIKVREGSYYGVGMARLLRENRGVHEPQEERVFAEVLKAIKPNSHMIELGAYWGFYSLWFARDIPTAHCILVEPSLSNLDYGRENFILNGKSAEFIQAFVGASAKADFDHIPELTVDKICLDRGIEQLAILHSDIQGAEYEMVLGAERMLRNHTIDFIFVSTHGEDLHTNVKVKLEEWGYVVLTDVSPKHSFSDDGILVLRSPNIKFALPFEVSLRL
jgi:Methyltransferase FkbM domain